MGLTKEQHRAIIEHDYHQLAFSRETYLDQLMQNQIDAKKFRAIEN